MNTKSTLTTLIAAATLAAGGLAFAQANPPTSTPGAGCTATANAMKGGNLGGNPSKTACAHEGSTDAAAAPVNPATTAAAPATTATTTSSTASTTSNSSAMGNTGAMAPVHVARAARADRN